MTKRDLIQKLSRRFSEIPEYYMEEIVDTFFKEIARVLVEKKRAEFRHFGAFSIRLRKSRVGRNPSTGEVVQVKEKAIPFFKCGVFLLTQLNGWKKKQELIKKSFS